MTCIRATWSGGGGRFGVLVHGGAGALESLSVGASEGCGVAADRALGILSAGGSALAAVEAAVVCLEDDDRFNAGLGAALSEAGQVELDASIMEGRDLRAGAVCALTHHRNAILVARAALEDGKHVFYAGEGARALARLEGIAEVEPSTLVTERARERLARALAGGQVKEAGNTVGAVARDLRGDVAAATSTGGVTGKRTGRIGDSPVIAAGTHAENGYGAASATGLGELILRYSLAFRATREMGFGRTPEQAAAEVLAQLHGRVQGLAGIILADSDGRLGLAQSTETMPWAARWDGAEGASGQ